MFKKLHYKVRGLPTPLAGLALGIASLGWCLEIRKSPLRPLQTASARHLQVPRY